MNLTAADCRRSRRLVTASERQGQMLISLLAAVAAIAVVAASFSSPVAQPSHVDRDALLRNRLASLRTQIEIYRYNHEDRLPTSDIVRQMTLRTTIPGEVSPDGSCGPYFVGGFLPNPVNGSSVVATRPRQSTDQTTEAGWFYDPTTGVIDAVR